MLREQASAGFGVVACTWPGSVLLVQARMPEATLVEVPELDRDQILRVIADLGVTGPRELQALIVNQARGRAGLAGTLAQACRAGRSAEVAGGAVLFDDTISWYAATVGPSSLSALAVLGLTGSDGPAIETLADCIGSSVFDASAIVQQLAAGGTIDEVVRYGRPLDRLNVQPEELRFALVKAVFSGASGVPIERVVDRFPTSRQAIIPLVGAVHRRARIPTDRITAVLDSEPDARTAGAVASLGERGAEFVIENFPSSRLEAAKAALGSDESRRLALTTLLQLAVGDTRARPSHPDHPLRIADDYLSGPQTAIEARGEAVAAAEQWVSAGGDPQVGLDLAAIAMAPGKGRS